MNDRMINDEVKNAAEEFLEAAHQYQGAKKLKSISRRLELSMQRGFRTQGAKFMKLFRERLRSSFEEGFEGHATFMSTPLKEVMGPADWIVVWLETILATDALFEGPIDKAVQTALALGATQAIAELGLKLSFDLANPRAAAYIQDYGAKLISGIDEESKGQIQTIIDQAIKEGWSYDKTAEALTDQFEQFAVGSPLDHIDSRAHLIAVTETGNAYAEGSMEIAQEMQDAGLNMEKYWSTVGDDKVSQTICAPNEDAGWIPLNDPFPSGHMRPLGHPGCRCDLMTRIVKKWAR